jgi:two-component system cell cycle response regulator
MEARDRSAEKGHRRARREKEIAVLAKGSTVLRFLEPFFKHSGIYRPAYYEKTDTFLKDLSATSPAAVIVEGSFLQRVVDKITRTPTVAVVSGETKKGIENVIRHQIRHYLYKPYVDRDLEYKLESAILERYTLEKLGEEMKELATLVEFGQLISSTLDPKKLLYRIVRKIAEVIPVTRCSMIRVDWIHRSAFVVASFEDPRVAGMRLSLKKYPEIIQALSSKKPVVIKDISTDPIMSKVRELIEPLGIRSILVIPIFFRDKVIGTLFLRTSRTHAFSQAEIRMLNTITVLSSNALNNAFLFEQVEDEKTRLEKLAITDYLTGIYNVRYFCHRIVEEFSRALRYELPVSCLMLDIDFFKRVNDAFGHKTGDKVLKEFALLLKSRCRKSDVLARYGGEEFILLLPETSCEGAVREAERLRDCVKNYSFRSLRKKDNLTVSVGVATFPSCAAKTHDDLIAFADHALFTAKKSGRDRVTVYQG